MHARSYEAGVEIEPEEFLGGVPDRYGNDGAWTDEPLLDGVESFLWFAPPRRDEFAFANRRDPGAGGRTSPAKAEK
jgi:hypothetical protein